MEQKILMYFAAHKGINTFFFTTTGSAFVKEADANAEQRNINKAHGIDGNVVTVTRAEADAIAAKLSAPASDGAAGAAGSEDAVDENELQVEVTQEMLDDNPELVEQGVQVGDTIGIPKDDTQTTPEEIKADVKAAAKTKTAKKKAAGKGKSGGKATAKKK